MTYEKVLTGATAVGLKVGEGVVIGAEKRISYGGFILSKSGKKVFRIGDRMAMAAAGLFGDMQTISRIITAEVMYRERLTSKKMSVRAAAKLLSTILYSYKLMPFISEIIFAGYDEEGFHLYVLDPVGSMIEDDYAAVGTGAAIAIGILESGYKKDLSLKEAEELCIKAIKTAASRDAVSGDGIDLAIISRNGVIEKSLPIV
ncbi:MAG: archaeal proteasome endopeptidase complex subunit beta [Desulfurococcaceae archaeon]|jgi:proteasome beta subunit|nr:archaeal proteasome endopeptidase complex subunit beta [Desulfurococcaceae archaeon]MCC6057864.1 archaeal proteasome endopeptidase complex subunit beta [Desulfurococcaceae archaeon]